MSSLALAHEQPNLWTMVWKLLRLRLVILISGFRRAKTRQKIGYIVLGLFILGLLVLAFVISWAVLNFLRKPEMTQFIGDMNALVESVPVMLVGGAFLGILLTSFGVLLQALYLAGDMDFLLSAPIPIRAVFISKLLQAILPNFSLICLFALPLLFGLGAARGYNILYYPLVLIILIALALAAAGLSSLLVMLVVRILPARRVAEVLGFIGAIVSLLCSQSGQLARWTDVSADQANQALQLASRFNQPWSPLAWAGRGLIDLGEGRWLSALLYLGLTLGITGAVFLIALTTSERLYYTGWASMQGILRKKKAPREAAAKAPKAARFAFPPLLGRWLPSPVRAIIAKDFLLLRRDLRNMSQLVTPLILGIIYAFMFLRSGGEPPPGRGEAPALFTEIMRNIMVYGNIGIALFVGWMLLGRLAGMSFSQEGKNYWLLKSSPVSSNRLILAKFLVAFLPVTALSLIFLVMISLIQKVSTPMVLYSIPVVILSIAGNTGINIAFGIAGAKLDWEDPRQMQRSGTSCLGNLAVLGYLPLSLVLFFGPSILLSLFQLSHSWGYVLGMLLGGAFSVACAILPPWLVRERVARLGEA